MFQLSFSLLLFCNLTHLPVLCFFSLSWSILEKSWAYAGASSGWLLKRRSIRSAFATLQKESRPWKSWLRPSSKEGQARSPKMWTERFGKSPLLWLKPTSWSRNAARPNLWTCWSAKVRSIVWTKVWETPTTLSLELHMLIRGWSKNMYWMMLKTTGIMDWGSSVPWPLPTSLLQQLLCRIMLQQPPDLNPIWLFLLLQWRWKIMPCVIQRLSSLLSDLGRYCMLV